MSSELQPIVPGTRLGRLIIGHLVSNVRDHPLFELMPPSYLRFGKIRECRCLCGTQKLICEYVLRSGRVRSCGCLMRERTAEANKARTDKARKKALRKENTAKLNVWREEKKTLKPKIIELRSQLVTQSLRWDRDEPLIQSITAELREVYRRKALLTDWIGQHKLRG